MAVTVTWIVQFVRFNLALNRVFEGTKVNPVSNVARWLFFVMVMGYAVPTVIRIFVNSEYLKVELELVSWPIFDFLAITPNLILHLKSFGATPPTEAEKS